MNQDLTKNICVKTRPCVSKRFSASLKNNNIRFLCEENGQISVLIYLVIVFNKKQLKLR